MTIGVWILGDQLSTEQAALQKNSPVIFIESLHHVQARPYHKQKLVLIWSAMRHFAEELRQLGHSVTYKTAENFTQPLIEWIKEHKITELRVMAPTDKPFGQLIQKLELPCKITTIPNNHFLWSSEEFQKWAKPRKRMLMEDFYREGRRRFDILMVGDKPIGGQWNLDKENRQPPKGRLNTPPAKWFEPDAITTDVIEYVNSLTIPTYGELENFRWGVTRKDALQVLDWFIENRLPNFGPYQDAMVTGEETMWHAMISPYLNIGLLQPLEVVKKAEQAYQEKQLPLNSVEGFIRQVMGWREYMHGIYEYVSADYPEKNWFNHTQPLPEFFWNGETKMNCLHQILTQVQDIGYAHHIQRLMVLSNFSLIAGFSPQEVENWFHSAFIDAYDWVMQTNVIGMGLFADGGILASKPYAASGNYVNKMSDYCKSCVYNPKERTGEKACPFNFFYWDFLARHREKLQSQGRMSFILANLDRMDEGELQTIQQQATEWHRENQ
ncbi:MAG: cryptochrome/photolyase family protein [Cyanomargarita calcarea GSE-NOS-MK-12-04C]|jgi:deoxyribodipyrimidine photolyase-related protein|uniref:Cryptochrome/photolyase family protein n=1 Tax=Cyanomargarita calcarea GSE-NOS-MK-12-04C TaxID=2839659 RepID=A0A951UT58_9CYAN|nr:cryptochrome/photolyase family protein [Cyanomargarita calcarea GSE-NOS-MK-12-04C]